MRKITAALALASLGSFVASQASAASNSIPYNDLPGTNFNFGGSPTFVDPIANPSGKMQETNDDGSATALYGAPAVSGDSLLFTPANFLAQAAGAGGLDTTGAQFQVVMTATALGATIDTLNISEFGDTTLFGAGTGATASYVGMSGLLTITEANGAPIAPVVICFPGPCTNQSAVTYSPAQFFLLPGDFGTKNWSASVSIDVASVVANATKAILSLDNDLIASSEAGTTSKIQKKLVDGPSIIVEVIPEPGTFALLSAGLLALTLRARGRRTQV